MTHHIRVEAPHFVAGVILDHKQVVIRAAPILKYMIGWKKHKVLGYCVQKGWKYGLEQLQSRVAKQSE
jgi:hypothetical protein